MKESKAKLSNRFLAMVLAFVMGINMIPVTAYASENEYDANNLSIVRDIDGTAADNGSGDTSGSGEDGENVQKEYYTLSVHIDGNASVTINNVEQNGITVESGTEVEVKITPDEENYIQTLTIGDENIIVEKGNTYVGKIKVIKNLEIKATIKREYFVTIADYDNEAGVVTVNEKTDKSVSVDSGSNAVVAVMSKSGYQIESVLIDGVEQTLTSVNSFKTTIENVNDNVQVTVRFMKIYTVTVVHNADGGTFVTTPEHVEGKVIVEPGKDVKITATPNANYRVSSIVIQTEDGQKRETTLDKNFEEGESYEIPLTVNEDYIVEITFAPNRYKILAEENIYGKVTIHTPVVEWGKESKITVVPNTNYSIGNITINDVEVESYEELDSGGIEFLISNITEDKNIKVSFTKTAFVTKANLTFSESLRTNGNTYIYNKVGGIISTDMNGIIIKGITEKGNESFQGTKEIRITKDITITEIRLYYKASNEKRANWHLVENVNSKNPIKVVIDKEAPVKINFTPEQQKDEDNNPIEGFYNDNVFIDVSVTEPESDYSGIQSIDYWIVKDGELDTEESVNLYAYKDGEKILEKVQNKVIEIDAVENNCYVEVYLQVTDRAGNQSEIYKLPLNINSTRPRVEVTASTETDDEILKALLEENGQLPEAGKNRYPDKRKVTITFYDRADTFDAEKAFESVQVYKKNENNEFVNIDEFSQTGVTKEWEQIGEQSEEHVLTICFDEEGCYKWEILSYMNLAGLNREDKITGCVKNFDELIIDKTNPKATFTWEKETWSEIIGKLTFGIFECTTVKVEIESEDTTSGIKSIFYYKSDARTDEPFTEAYLEELYHSKSNPFVIKEYSVDKDEQFMIYARVTDWAGRTTYISTDRIIVDCQKPTICDEPKIRNDIYTDDVQFNITFQEANLGDIYSGLAEINYKISSNDLNKVEEGTIINESKSNNHYIPDEYKVMTTDKNNFIQKYSATVIIPAEEFNCNDVQVEIYAVDKAGNKSETFKADVKIDITEPEVFIEYNNNSVNNGKYFNASRTATITVKERNFDASNSVKINVNGREQSYTFTQISEGTGNKDDTTWEVKVPYTADGDYTFDMSCTDLAGWTSKAPTYKNGTVVPTAFTIDTTAPTISVSYNNNSAKNGKYFKDERTATITVIERNFDSSRVQDKITASLNGKTISAPSISWSSNGDKHTGVIKYSSDGDYTFDIQMTDLATNPNASVSYGNSTAAKEFTIDKTIEQPTISGVEDGMAYSGQVIPKIEFKDVNFDAESYSVLLVRTRMNEKGVEVTDTYMKNIRENSQGFNGEFDTFIKSADTDGIYTLTINATDKAGNAAETETVTFSINRYGSVYAFDDYLNKLTNEGISYNQSIKNDLVITEYNADKLVKDSLVIEITRDGKPLEKVLYDVTPDINEFANVGSSGWYQYSYTISKENFLEDGIYKVFISSKDKAGNEPENGNYDDKEITFVVDNTSPEITSIVGLEEKSVKAESHQVTYTVFDAIGLKSISVYVDGELVDDKITDFGDDPNNYTGSFVLTEKDTAQHVRIIVEDLAGKITDTDDNKFESAYVFNKDITITTSTLILWYNNKPLFWGTIIGIVCLAVILWFIIAKRKKDGEEAR